MATSVILPKQGQSVETCIITEWYKKKGERVEKGELLFAYETDKSSFEEEAKEDGVLLEVYFGAGDEVPVLTEIAVIGEPGEEIAARPEVPFVASGVSSGPGEEPSIPFPETEPGISSPDAQSSARSMDTGSPKPSKEPEPTIQTAETPVPFEEVEPSASDEGPGSFLEETAGNGDKIKISPRARKMAELKGIPLAGILGTGPAGRIIVRDIEALAGAPKAKEAAPETASETVPGDIPETAPEATSEKVPGTAPETVPGTAPEEIRETATGEVTDAVSEKIPEKVPGLEGDWQDRPLTNMRKLIAKAMHASLQNSAQLTHHLGADARSILSLRSKIKKMQAEGYPHNVTLNDMICFATLRALKKHPQANVHFLGDSIRYFRNIHLGIAVDTDRGLMVPVIRFADDFSLVGLSNQIARLAGACRTGKVDPDLLQPEAATFTVSNLGNYGVEMFTPVINLPQAAILGVNTILERPARMEDGTLGFIPYLGLSLTYDHRAIDGGPATLFLAEVKKEIEQFNHELINL